MKMKRVAMSVVKDWNLVTDGTISRMERHASIAILLPYVWERLRKVTQMPILALLVGDGAE